MRTIQKLLLEEEDLKKQASCKLCRKDFAIGDDAIIEKDVLSHNDCFWRKLKRLKDRSPMSVLQYRHILNMPLEERLR